MGEVFYIHHDGYPEGATNKFQSFLENMFVKQTTYKGKTEWVRRRKLHHAFIAGLPKAEESSHDEHGDTEWQYRISWVDQENIWPTYPEKGKERDFDSSTASPRNACGSRKRWRTDSRTRQSTFARKFGKRIVVQLDALAFGGIRTNH